MGRGRQKAKQTKIARKLKYLTTDTNYDELAKELSGKEPGKGENDPFSVVEAEFDNSRSTHDKGQDEAIAGKETQDQPGADRVDDDLDDYARWAAEAAAKASSGEIPATSKIRRRIPIPTPGFLAQHTAGKRHQPSGAGEQPSEDTGKNDSADSQRADGKKTRAARGTEQKSSSTDQTPQESVSQKSGASSGGTRKGSNSRKTGARTKTAKSGRTAKKTEQEKAS